MQQEPAVESFEEQFNYPKAFIGAIIDATIGILIWASIVYFPAGYSYIASFLFL